MAMKLFGFEFKRSDDSKNSYRQLNRDMVVRPQNDMGALEVNRTIHDFQNFSMDLLGSIGDESSLINRYRGMALDMDVKTAVDEIVNEIVSVDNKEHVVKIITDDIPFNDKIKEVVAKEFDNLLILLDFSNQAYDIVKNFYVDGRLNYHVSIDKDKPHEGIQMLRYMDPRKTRFVREYDDSQRDYNSGASLVKLVREYFLYHEGAFIAQDQIWNSMSTTATSAIMMPKDSVVRVTSGIVNERSTVVLSWLHQAIRPFNQLKMLEDCILIYRIVRAPERKVFYIDTGNMSTSKSEQYLRDMMARHKNKLTFDSTNGEVRSDKNVMSMTYDYWFSRREGKGTQVDVLPGGQGLGDLEDLAYFQKKLFRSLIVPLGRMESDTMFNMGRPTEITREEIKFGKFIRRIRARFTILFDELLYRQLLLKNIITEEEWAPLRDAIRYDFLRDNYFEELKEMELLSQQLAALRDADELLTGKYRSEAWVARKILRMTDEEYAEERKMIKKEEEMNPPQSDDF